MVIAWSFLIAFPVLAASPLQGTHGKNCFEVLYVGNPGPGVEANLAFGDLICAVNGMRFGVEHHPTLSEEPDSLNFVVDYIDSVGTATLEVYRDGVIFQTDIDITGPDEVFNVDLMSVFLQIGPTHGRAKRLGIQDGDVMIHIGELGDPHLLLHPISASETTYVTIRRGKGEPFTLQEGPFIIPTTPEE